MEIYFDMGIVSIQKNDGEKVTGNSHLVLANRKNLQIKGVERVKSTMPNQVVAIVAGASMSVNGNDLSVENLSVTTGNLEISGTINEIKFSGVEETEKKSFFKKLFS